MPEPERIPTVAQMRTLAGCLETLALANPPPSRLEMALLRGDGWAIGHNGEVQLAVEVLESILTAPPYYDRGSRTLRGWPTRYAPHLARAEQLAVELLAEWGMTRYADLPPYPGQPPDGARAGNPLAAVPLVPSEEQCKDLAWCLDGVRKALASVPPAPAPAPPKVYDRSDLARSEWFAQNTGVKPDTLYKAGQRGTIHRERFGRIWLYSISEAKLLWSDDFKPGAPKRPPRRRNRIRKKPDDPGTSRTKP